MEENNKNTENNTTGSGANAASTQTAKENNPAENSSIVNNIALQFKETANAWFHK